jgi:cell division protein FtsW
VILYFISLPLLAYTLLFGANINNGSRWIKLPVVNLTFQSSDLAKLALFMFLARILSMKQDVIEDFRKGFVPVLVPMVLVCGLIAPAGRVQFKHLLFLVCVGIMMLSVIFTVSVLSGKGRAKTWVTRVQNFSGNEKANLREQDTFQVYQSKIAIANGGLFGRGPGQSEQRNNLPHPYSDFIYAIIVEEYGLVGGSVVMLLYLLFLWRSILIFRRCPFAFGAFLAIGLSFTLVFQAMLNMAVTVHLVPVTGLTLPMISMGGSSIWFTSIAIGIVLSVSRYVDEMEGVRKSKAKKIIEMEAEEEDEEETEELQAEKKPKAVIEDDEVSEVKTEKKPRTKIAKDNTPLPAI